MRNNELSKLEEQIKYAEKMNTSLVSLDISFAKATVNKMRKLEEQFEIACKMLDKTTEMLTHEKCELEEKLHKTNQMYGNCCLERQRLEKALDKVCLRLADISVEDDKDNDYQVVNQAKVFKEEILEQVRKELENAK